MLGPIRTAPKMESETAQARVRQVVVDRCVCPLAIPLHQTLVALFLWALVLVEEVGDLLL